MKRASLAAAAASLACLLSAGAGHTQSLGGAPPPGVNLDVVRWKIIDRESGPVNYYQSVNDPALPFVHARYVPPMHTAVLGYEVADADRRRASTISWQWRAITLPNGGDECADGKGDSAAVVYLTWKQTLRWYTLKYVWSAVGKRGAVCDRKRNPFVAQDTIILESGGPLGTWKAETIDLRREFRNHFDNGDPKGDVPDFVGIGIMTDGDQTKSESSADYAGFVMQR
ncbi:MAG TPA: DUF3047 domain-containing protein [Polyangiaceae bacterium]|jgi:hypothetical protein|nr:DUF3047 domain-containing protein [Polyangiaceae bacterium]